MMNFLPRFHKAALIFVAGLTLFLNVANCEVRFDISSLDFNKMSRAQLEKLQRPIQLEFERLDQLVNDQNDRIKKLEVANAKLQGEKDLSIKVTVIASCVTLLSIGVCAWVMCRN